MAAAPDFEDLIKIIRGTGTAEEKKVAAATITLRLIRAQAMGGQIPDYGAHFDSSGTTFRTTVTNIQTSIANI